MPSEKAVVLLSGGLNAAVATSLARADYLLAALHVRFGHRADQREAELFEKQADHFEIRERLVINMPHFTAIGVGARVSRKEQIEDALALEEGVSNCHTPGLIGSLIHAAFTWSRAIHATRIVLGISEDLGPPSRKTRVIYPDYSREFLQLCSLSFAAASPDRPVSIETPLIDMSRTEIIKLGHRLETPLELTWSCLSSGTQACGACLGCATRNRGFLDAAFPDPVYLQPVGR